MKMTTQEKRREAYKLGFEAHSRGDKRIPIHDKNITYLLKDLPIGNEAKLILQAWLSGWDYRNLNS